MTENPRIAILSQDRHKPPSPASAAVVSLAWQFSERGLAIRKWDVGNKERHLCIVHCDFIYIPLVANIHNDKIN